MRILKKILKWAGIVISGLVIIIFVTHIILNIVWGRELRTKLAELKAKGEPTTIAEIRPKPVPDNENAALIYNEIFALKKILEARYSKEWEYMPLEGFIDYDKLSPEQKKTISNLIFHNPDFIRFYQLIEEAAMMPYCQFVINYEKIYLGQFTHLAEMRGVTRMIGAKMLLKADQGDIESALETAYIGLLIGHSLENEPILISQLLRFACINLIYKSMKDAIGDEIPPENISRKLIKELESFLDTTSFLKSLHREAIFIGLHNFKFKQIERTSERIFGIRLSFLEWFRNLLATDNIMRLGMSRKDYFFSRFRSNILYRPLLKREKLYYLSAINKIIEIGNKPYSQINVEMEMLLKSFLKPKIHLSAIRTILSSYKHMVCLQAETEIRRVGLALKVYKSKHQQYPDSLKFLSPEILTKIPKDPFTNQYLIYKKAKDGFILYSLGTNMKDDGGIPRFCGKAKTDADRKARKDNDIVWKCEK